MVAVVIYRAMGKPVRQGCCDVRSRWPAAAVAAADIAADSAVVAGARTATPGAAAAAAAAAWRTDTTALVRNTTVDFAASRPANTATRSTRARTSPFCRYPVDRHLRPSNTAAATSSPVGRRLEVSLLTTQTGR